MRAWISDAGRIADQGLGERHTQRLRREAQAMAKLSHPNVVQVYEVGEAEAQTFVAMELVKGRTLQEWMRHQPRSDWRACVQVFIQVGAGLAAAHERGLIHRDFKPSNAIIDEKGRPRVLDFGLARQGGEVDDEPNTTQRARTNAHEAMLETALTDTGAVLGTPAYMPPEQMEGRQVDARSDQFSFCVSFYEVQPCGSQSRGTTRLLAQTLGILRGWPLVWSGREWTRVDGIRHHSSKTLLDGTARDRRASVATVATPGASEGHSQTTP